MNKVSIVIPTFKRPEMLERALKSIFSQTYSNIEVIIVDDNGTNRDYDSFYKEIISKYNIKYVRNEKNMGAALSRNRGIEVATGRYISFLDDDDTYCVEKIEKQVQLIENSTLSNVGFVYCQMTRFDETLTKRIDTTKNYYRGNSRPFKNNMLSCIAGTPTILVKAELIKSIGGFRNIKSGQDWCLVLDLLNTGCNVDYNTESLVNVCIHQKGRISTSNAKLNSLQNEILPIKQSYLKGFDQHFSNQVLFYHYYQIASALKYKDKVASLKYARKALNYGFEIKPVIKYAVTLISGQKIAEAINKNFNQYI